MEPPPHLSVVSTKHKPLSDLDEIVSYVHLEARLLQRLLSKNSIQHRRKAYIVKLQGLAHTLMEFSAKNWHFLGPATAASMSVVQGENKSDLLADHERVLKVILRACDDWKRKLLSSSQLLLPLLYRAYFLPFVVASLAILSRMDSLLSILRKRVAFKLRQTPTCATGVTAKDGKEAVSVAVRRRGAESEAVRDALLSFLGGPLESDEGDGAAAFGFPSHTDDNDCQLGQTKLGGFLSSRLGAQSGTMTLLQNSCSPGSAAKHDMTMQMSAVAAPVTGSFECTAEAAPPPLSSDPSSCKLADVECGGGLVPPTASTLPSLDGKLKPRQTLSSRGNNSVSSFFVRNWMRVSRRKLCSHSGSSHSRRNSMSYFFVTRSRK
eukprot:GHVU01202550.1.p1 GENE.GHVU01202550.1~~GHVU01202550.1.p1  ORF type:complete len:378 (+),score=31.29 GHVU01202550.1:85-1218(+)